MPLRFAYTERRTCACGADLAAAASIEKSFPPGPVRFQLCGACGSWVQSPVVATESLRDWYDSDEYQAAGGGGTGAYLDYEAGEAARLKEAVHRLHTDFASRLRPGAGVLEVGCASGSLLHVLREAGYRVHGIDMSRRFARMAERMHGLDVEVGDFLQLRDLPGPFDCVVMLGTISNLQDVSRHMERVREVLKPGGLLYFNFPATDTVAARLYGRRFWMYAPSVVNFMSRKGCALLLRRCGFTMESMTGDRQFISLDKALGHGRLPWLQPPLKRLGLNALSTPWAVPAPSVFKVIARS